MNLWQSIDSLLVASAGNLFDWGRRVEVPGRLMLERDGGDAWETALALEVAR